MGRRRGADEVAAELADVEDAGGAAGVDVGEESAGGEFPREADRRGCSDGVADTREEPGAVEEGEGRVGTEREVPGWVGEVVRERVGGYHYLVVADSAGFGLSCGSGGEDESAEIGHDCFCGG